MRWNASRELKLAALSALVAALLYLPALGARVLVTDEAKDALNIPYPHPPILRALMGGSQAAFGFTPFAARLPVALLSAAAVGLLAYWLLRRGHSARFTFAAALLFAAAPGFSVWARSAYLSAPLAAFWMLALLGADRLARDPKDRLGDWLLLAAAAFGLWSQFHGVLILPTVAWLFWRRRAALRSDPSLRNFLALHIMNVAFFGLYVAGSPFIVSDLLSFSRNAPAASLGPIAAISSAGRAVAYWLAVSMLACFALMRRFKSEHDLGDEAVTASFVAALIWLLLNPTEYYLPYLLLPLWAAIASSWKAAPQGARIALVALVLVSLAIRPMSQVSRSLEDFYVTRAEEWKPAVAGEPAVAFLGDYGYEAQYLSPVPVKKQPRDAAARAEIRHAFVVEPGSLSADEQRWLEEEFRLEKEIGIAKMYVREAKSQK